MKISIIDKEFEQKVEVLEMTITELRAKYSLQHAALIELQLKQEILEESLNQLIRQDDLDPVIHKFNGNLKSLREDIVCAEKITTDYLYKLAENRDMDLSELKSKSVNFLHDLANRVESLPEQKAS